MTEGLVSGAVSSVAQEPPPPLPGQVTVPLKSTLRVTETEPNPLSEVADEYWSHAAWDTRLALKLLADVKGPSRFMG